MERTSRCGGRNVPHSLRVVMLTSRTIRKRLVAGTNARSLDDEIPRYDALGREGATAAGIISNNELVAS